MTQGRCTEEGYSLPPSLGGMDINDGQVMTKRGLDTAKEQEGSQG